MNYLFLPFNLYKPYLLLMYDIRESIMILKFLSKYYLQKNIVAQRKKTSNATKV